ncbi:MAG: ribosome biogenesis GTPase YlqF [Candidatus Izemoplasmatales bacterium]|nr:ribosome biogenesis GTPase YlqF [Candidatus Izemoplasmatales bacterium]MDD4069914.1 ribosome biogenesis GTPase YlqF [Candidatus Izemoplasmatales bacterium]MDY0139047.1 ribosome biogenesis GTPase YlqF [Candidatus Izemoplasmatales bacterium]
MKQIQWFPGHMAKARRQIEEKLKVIDIVYELVDARIPLSSSNPMLNEIIKNKPKIVFLNKLDLADPEVTNSWISYYEKKRIPVLAINSLNDSLEKDIYNKTKEVLKEEIKKDEEKGLINRPFNAMVLGIPNVGKSQFINNLAKKNKVRVGNKPGVTKMQSFLKAGDYLRVYDNPGVLWPKFDDESVGLKLALLGSIKDSILPLDDITLFGIDYLKKYYKKNIEKRYNIDLDSLETNIDVLNEIGKRRGCLISGGEIDYDRVYNLFLNDLRNGQLGRMSFERIDEDV